MSEQKSEGFRVNEARKNKSKQQGKPYGYSRRGNNSNGKGRNPRNKHEKYDVEALRDTQSKSVENVKGAFNTAGDLATVANESTDGKTVPQGRGRLVNHIKADAAELKAGNNQEKEEAARTRRQDAFGRRHETKASSAQQQSSARSSALKRPAVNRKNGRRSESLVDIKRDNARLEKDISLEIASISTLNIGL